MDTITRRELIHDVGFHAFKCGLCGHKSNSLSNISHASDCPLKDPGVTHVQMTGLRSRVVLSGPRDKDGKLWWRSWLSGMIYDIEHCGSGRSAYWRMSRDTAAVSHARLSDIRKYIVDNQGVL